METYVPPIERRVQNAIKSRKIIETWPVEWNLKTKGNDAGLWNVFLSRFVNGPLSRDLVNLE